MKRVAVKQLGKLAVVLGRLPPGARCPAWTARVRRAMAVCSALPRLRKLM